jgi:TonB family protein
VLSIFNLQFAKLNAQYAETIVDIELVEEEKVEQEEESASSSNKKRTNKGYNKTEKYKPLSKAYKAIAPPKDYKRKSIEQTETPSEKESASKNKANSDIKTKELTTFKSVNSILNKHSNKKESVASEASANTNSSIYYSLKGRTNVYLPIPVYLCDAGGKVVVRITVNSSGQVIKTIINSALSSKNQCLQDNALEYAKEARFTESEIESQIGTITFNFKRKS